MMKGYEECLRIVNADYGTRYTIGHYQLAPEKKLILENKMFGTDLIDAAGFFPEPSLKYDEVTMVVFAGSVFLYNPSLGINWSTVDLLSYSKNHSEFTDGNDLYHMSYGSDIRKIGAYHKNDYVKMPDSHYIKERLFPEDYRFGDEMDAETLKKIKADIPAGRIALGRNKYISFYVLNDVFYYEEKPIYEKYDVQNLKTIVSTDGFATDYITDGKKVIFGGEKGGYSFQTIEGEDYVVTEDWMVDGVDFSSLKVLGENILMDKNALYYETNVIPFDKLEGFHFILREIKIT